MDKKLSLLVIVIVIVSLITSVVTFVSMNNAVTSEEPSTRPSAAQPDLTEQTPDSEGASVNINIVQPE